MFEGTFSDISAHITRFCVNNNKEVYIHNSPLSSDYATKSGEIGWIISIKIQFLKLNFTYNEELGVETATQSTCLLHPCSIVRFINLVIFVRLNQSRDVSYNVVT